MSRQPAVVVGDRFGRLTVASEHGRTKYGGVLWLCRCDCGKERVAESHNLRRASIRSCGCLQIESAVANQRSAAKANRTHGYSNRSPTYRSWEAMKYRCLRPSSSTYYKYGARGVRVCDRWMSFENFLADMGERPNGHSIDRIDPLGNYEPSNCRWATPKQQASNKRCHRIAELMEQNV